MTLILLCLFELGIIHSLGNIYVLVAALIVDAILFGVGVYHWWRQR